MTLKEALQHILDNGPLHRCFGICGNVHKLTDTCYDDEIEELALSWPQHADPTDSGIKCMPIPGSYFGHSRKNQLWEGEQRELRMSLIRHILEQLEDE